MSPRILLVLVAALCSASTVTRAEEPKPPPALGGFDVGLEVWETSGLVGAVEAYENQLTFVLEPSYALGEQLLKGTYWEKLTLSGRLLWTNELAGNDPTFRGPHFASPALFGSVASNGAAAAAPARSIDGAVRESNLSDLWVGAGHDELAKIPFLDADLQGRLRLSFPTSSASWASGLVLAPSLYVGLARKFGPVELGYGVRGVKYFHTTATTLIDGDLGPVVVNGQAVEPYRPESSGSRNPDWGLTQLFSVDVELPHDLAISLFYALSDTWVRAITDCSVPGVPTADTCRDGALLGDVRNPAIREDGYLNVEIGWKAAPWATLGLGYSTATATRLPDGSLANPFWRGTRDNLSTLYLSVGSSAEELTRALRPK